MKDYKRKLVLFKPFDYEGIEKYLEEMAAEGWRLEKMEGLWRFKRSEPARVHYSVVFLPKNGQFDPEYDQNMEEFDEYCGASGWTRVCSSNRMHIYCSEEDDPTPIETDESLKLKCVKKSIVSMYVVPMLCCTGLILFNLGIGDMFDPEYLFSSYSIMLTILICLLLAITVVATCLGFWAWVRRSVKSIESGGGCMPTSGFHTLYKVSYSLAILALIGWAVAMFAENDGSTGFVVVFTVIIIALISIFAGYLMKSMRKSGVSKKKNKIITYGVSTVLFLAAFAAMCVWLLVITDGEDNWSDVEKNKLTLTSEDLRDVGGIRYDYTFYGTKTFLMSYEKGEEYSDIDITGSEDPVDTYDVAYEIVQTEKNWLYDMCLKQQLKNTYHEEESWHKEKYSGLHAETVYQLYFQGSPDGEWVFCYPDAIAHVMPYFEVNEDDLKKIDQIMYDAVK